MIMSNSEPTCDRLHVESSYFDVLKVDGWVGPSTLTVMDGDALSTRTSSLTNSPQPPQEYARVQREINTLCAGEDALHARHITARQRLEAVDVEARRQAESISILRQQKAEL